MQHNASCQLHITLLYVVVYTHIQHFPFSFSHRNSIPHFRGSVDFGTSTERRRRQRRRSTNSPHAVMWRHAYESQSSAAARSLHSYTLVMLPQYLHCECATCVVQVCIFLSVWMRLTSWNKLMRSRWWTNQLNQTASTIDICISRSSVVVHRTQDLNLHFEFIVVIHLIYIRYKGDDANCGGWLVGGARVKENLRTMRLCNTIYTISKMTLVHDVFKYIIYREADFWALFGHSIANICVILCVGCLALVNSCEMYHLYTRKAMDICNTVKCYTSEHLYSFFSPTAMVVLLTICCSFNYVFYVCCALCNQSHVWTPCISVCVIRVYILINAQRSKKGGTGYIAFSTKWYDNNRTRRTKYAAYYIVYTYTIPHGLTEYTLERVTLHIAHARKWMRWCPHRA